LRHRHLTEFERVAILQRQLGDEDVWLRVSQQAGRCGDASRVCRLESAAEGGDIWLDVHRIRKQKPERILGRRALSDGLTEW